MDSDVQTINQVLGSQSQSQSSQPTDPDVQAITDTLNSTNTQPSGKDNPSLVFPGEDMKTSGATAQAIAAGAEPKDLIWARSQLGKKEYEGWCQSFVSKATGEGWKGSSAIDAFQRQRSIAHPNLKGIKPGDLVYFKPNASNEGYGHTGIYSGNNRFVSATDNGVREYDLNAWKDLTGQDPLGFIPYQDGGQQ